MDQSDQRTKVTVIQEQGLPLREASVVVPDLSAAQYQVPRPPPPPLFSMSSQAKPSARKRSRDAAFGGDGSSANSPNTWPSHRPKLATISSGHAEYAPLESVEHDAPQEEDYTPNRRRESPVDLTKDLQLSMSRRTANVGHEMADHKILADVEPKSESPEPGVPLQCLKPTSRFSLEVLDSAATAQNVLKPTPSIGPAEQGESLLKSRDNRRTEIFLDDDAPALPSKESSAGRRAVALVEASVPEGAQHGPTTNALSQTQLQLQACHNRPHAPITPPSDASPADMRRKLAPTSAISSARATSASNRFKPTIPRRDVFEPQSSIEDSQMSARSKKKNRPHVDREASSTTSVRSGARSVPKTASAKVPFSQAAQLYDQGTPIVLKKRTRNEPAYGFSETLSILGEGDDYQPRSYRKAVENDLEPAGAMQYAIHDALGKDSIDQSVADSPETKEKGLKTSSRVTLAMDQHSRSVQPDAMSASLSREHSEYTDQTDNDSNKENHVNDSYRRLSGMQANELLQDAEMEDAFSGDETNLSASGSSISNTQTEDMERPTEIIESSPDPRNKHQTTITILNGGDFTTDNLEPSSITDRYGRRLGADVRWPMEEQDNAKLATDGGTNRPRRKQSRVEEKASLLETGLALVENDVEKDEPEKDILDGRHEMPTEAWQMSNRTKARSDVETPTSTGSAGYQLQENLQESTQARNRSTSAKTTSRDDSGFSVPSSAKEDSRPIKNKVYVGIVRAIERDSARIELQGVKGTPCAPLHRNGIVKQSFKGPISQFLSLEQVINVKVNKVSGDHIKLSMLNVDQNSWEPTQTILVEQEKQPCEPALTKRDPSQAGPVQVPALNANNAEDVTSSHVKPKTSKVDKTNLGDEPVDIVAERHEETPQEFVAVGTGDKTGSDMEVTGSFDRKGTPENGGQPEARFGLGFTNTPRKRKKTKASVEGTASPVPVTAPAVRTIKEQRSLQFKDAPPVDSPRNEEPRDLTSLQSRPALKPSASRSKDPSVKLDSKGKLREKQSKPQHAAKEVGLDAKEHKTRPRRDSSASANEVEPIPRQQASLVTRLPATDKEDVEPDEYTFFPPGMTREQYLAKKKANTEAIARRDASAAGKASVGTPSKPSKAHSGIQSTKTAIKKQKDRPVGERSLSAAFETPPPMVQTDHENPPKDKRHNKKYNLGDATMKSLSPSQKDSKTDRNEIGGQKDGALAKRSQEKANGREGKHASTDILVVGSQATATPTPSKSISPSPIQSSNIIVPAGVLKSPSKPKPPVSNPSTANPTPARTLLTSKALSMAELKAQKEAAKKSSNASSSSLPSYKPAPTASGLRTALTLGSDSDESESESESESSSDGTGMQKSGIAGVKKKPFRKAAPKPDPTIRDRSTSADVDDDDESD